MSALLEAIGGARAALLLLMTAVLMPVAWVYQGNAINLPVLFYFALGLLLLLPTAISGLLKDSEAVAGRRSVLVALGLYLAVCSFSWFVSVVPEVSAVHWWLRLAFVAGCLAFIYLGNRVPTAGLARLMLAACCVGCAVWGLIEFVGNPRRATGPFMDPNNFALLCAVGIMLLLPELARAGDVPSRRFACWIGLTLLTLALFCAFSRAMSLIWLAGVLGFTALAWRSRVGRGNLLAYIGLGVVCYLLSISLAPDLGARVTGTGDLQMTLDVRQAMWQSTMNMWRDHPLLGAGIGTFRILYPSYRSVADQVTAGNSPHNDYLLGLAEGGPLLLALYLFLAGAVVWRGLSLARQLLAGSTDREDVQRLLANAALALAAGALLTHALVNFVTITLSLQFLLGCIVGLLFATPRANGNRDFGSGGDEVRAAVPERVHALAVVLVIVALLLPLRVLTQDALAYAVFLEQKGMPYARAIGRDGALYLKFAEQLDAMGPRRGLPAFGVATYFEGLANRAQGEQQKEFARRAGYFYALAIERLPLNHRAYLAWAGLCMQPWALDLDKAAELSRLAALIDPTDIRVYSYAAQIELRRGNERAAYDILRKGFFPWAFLGASTRANDTEQLLLQLRTWTVKYGNGPSLAAIDARLARAHRVQEAVRIETALGWRG